MCDAHILIQMYVMYTVYEMCTSIVHIQDIHYYTVYSILYSKYRSNMQTYYTSFTQKERKTNEIEKDAVEYYTNTFIHISHPVSQCLAFL